MASRRCSPCGRDYPLGTYRCPSCGAETWHCTSDNADEPSAAAPEPTEFDRVEAWRFTQLLDAGYPADTAIQIAERHEVDLHHALELVHNGCPAETAGRILL